MQDAFFDPFRKNLKQKSRLVNMYIKVFRWEGECENLLVSKYSGLWSCYRNSAAKKYTFIYCAQNPNWSLSTLRQLQIGWFLLHCNYLSSVGLTMLMSTTIIATQLNWTSFFLPLLFPLFYCLFQCLYKLWLSRKDVSKLHNLYYKFVQGIYRSLTYLWFIRKYTHSRFWWPNDFRLSTLRHSLCQAPLTFIASS